MGITNQIPSSRLIQPGVCTSSTRPASPYEGQAIFETDTDRMLIYNGTAWIVINGGASSYQFVETVYFTSNGTFSKASYPWLRAIRVRAVGAGGGGGGCAATGSGQASMGAGGNGGHYVEKLITDISSLSSSVTVTVGAGGAGGAVTAGGSNGGNSSFGSIVVAGGGNGGGGTSGAGAVPVANNPSSGSGGTSSGFDLEIRGAFAQMKITLSADFPARAAGGASHLSGTTTENVTVSSGSSDNGIVYGGGGAGGVRGTSQGTGRTGGTGAAGIVILELCS